MSGTLTPTGLRWNDPGDSTWDTDENSNIQDLNDDILKPDGLADVDNTLFSRPEQIIRRDAGGDYDIINAPYASELMTTTTSTTSTTTT